jgi:hypothetical protein
MPRTARRRRRSIQLADDNFTDSGLLQKTQSEHVDVASDRIYRLLRMRLRAPELKHHSWGVKHRGLTGGYARSSVGQTARKHRSHTWDLLSCVADETFWTSRTTKTTADNSGGQQTLHSMLDSILAPRASLGSDAACAECAKTEDKSGAASRQTSVLPVRRTCLLRSSSEASEASAVQSQDKPQ